MRFFLNKIQPSPPHFSLPCSSPRPFLPFTSPSKRIVCVITDVCIDRGVISVSRQPYCGSHNHHIFCLLSADIFGRFRRRKSQFMLWSQICMDHWRVNPSSGYFEVLFCLSYGLFQWLLFIVPLIIGEYRYQITLLTNEFMDFRNVV